MKVIDIHMHVPPGDITFEKYLPIMDRHNVEAALVHGMPWEGQDNPETLRATQAHPDRLFGSVHVDLRDPLPECIELVRRYAGEGFRSIKMFPNFGFDPNEEQYEPFWAVVEELGLMCLPHCGWLTNKGSFAKQRFQSLTATPFHFEMPARRFPGIRFIFAHFGGGASYLETVTLTTRLANAYTDICPGWGRWVFAQRMPGLGELDFSKILYGTDGAGEGYSADIQWWRQTLLSMGRTEDDCRRLLHDNAAALLGLVPGAKG